MGAELVCQEDGEAVAQAFVSTGKAPRSRRPLAAKVLSGDGVLHAKSARCPVLVLARPLPGAEHPSVFDWQRPAGEAARAMGGSIIDCAHD